MAFAVLPEEEVGVTPHGDQSQIGEVQIGVDETVPRVGFKNGELLGDVFLTHPIRAVVEGDSCR